VNLSEWAGEVRGLADRAESELAPECAREAGTDFLTTLRVVTPKRTGHLMDSESLDAVTGGGPVATAVVGAHAVYAEFRNNGGTITKHTPGSLGTPAVGFFGHSVTQRGAHYFEKAEELSRPAIQAACQAKLAEFLVL
jgi:phage gpG-like protein